MEIIEDYKIEKTRCRVNDNITEETVSKSITYLSYNHRLTTTRVGALHEAPLYLQDNEYIKGGYRINFNSVKHIFKRYSIIT